MADPVTIIGAAASIAAIIEILGETISAIAQWRETDLAVLALESQLTTLRAALGKVKEWTEANFEDPHHQLVMDMDRCVACCRVLIRKLHLEISGLQFTDDNKLGTASRLKLLLKTKDIENIQRMMEQQTNALTLLLTACNMTVTREQKLLLEQPQTRRVFKRMEDDTASLYVHRDIDSLFTQTATSINSSKRSLVFDFDKDLFISRIYERWIRGSVKKSLRDQQSDGSSSAASSRRVDARSVLHLSRSYDEHEAIEISTRIDRTLEADYRIGRREYRVLVLGADSRVKIVGGMKLVGSRVDGWREPQSEYRIPIFQKLIADAKALVEQATELDPDGPKSDRLMWQQIKLIADYMPEDSLGEMGLRANFREALSAVLNSAWLQGLREQGFRPRLSDHAEMYFNRLSIICSDGYIPNDVDTMYLDSSKTPAINEHVLSAGMLNIRLIDIGSRQHERKKKWTPFFEGVISVIYVVDLDTYDAPGVTESILDSLRHFNEIINSRLGYRGSIILLLANQEEFASKLARSPLEKYFPDYEGGADPAQAAGYIAQRFASLNRAGTEFYAHLVDNNNLYATLRFVHSVVKETIINIDLKSSGIVG